MLQPGPIGSAYQISVFAFESFDILTQCQNYLIGTTNAAFRLFDFLLQGRDELFAIANLLLQ